MSHDDHGHMDAPMPAPSTGYRPDPFWSYGMMSENFPHWLIGLSFFFYGAYVLCAYLRRDRDSLPYWKARVEVPVMIYLAAIQGIGPTFVFVTKGACNGELSCNRIVLHSLAAASTLIGALFAQMFRKNGGGRGHMDFGIPLTGFISGFFIKTHDHRGPETVNLMATSWLHAGAGTFMMVSSLLRLASDYYPEVTPLFAYAVSCTGGAMFFAGPSIYGTPVNKAHIEGDSLLFLSMIIVFLIYSALYYYFLRFHRPRTTRGALSLSSLSSSSSSSSSSAGVYTKLDTLNAQDDEELVAVPTAVSHADE